MGLEGRGQCAEAGDEGRRLPCGYGGLPGVSVAGQGGNCRLLRALAMGVPSMGGVGGCPLGHVGET